jgi:D-alanine transaminase
VAYVNGQYVPHAKAQVSIDDRGHVFSDGVYEVILVAGGRMIDEEGHMVRLERSLRELDMPQPMSSRALVHVMNQTIKRNRVQNGMVYLQINRGAAPRNHVYDNEALHPSVVCTAKSVNLPSDADSVAGVKVITEPDIRWGRVDIKTVSLLPNALAKTKAAQEGAYEAFLVDDDGFVTECSASNAWIVDQDGRVITRPLNHEILPGITRDRVIKLAKQCGIEVIERPFTVAEAKSAREAFLTSTTSFVKPVTQIDEVTVGNGHPGTVTRTLLGAYLDFVRGIKPSTT